MFPKQPGCQPRKLAGLRFEGRFARKRAVNRSDERETSPGSEPSVPFAEQSGCARAFALLPALSREGNESQRSVVGICIFSGAVVGQRDSRSRPTVHPAFASRSSGHFSSRRKRACGDMPSLAAARRMPPWLWLRVWRMSRYSCSSMGARLRSTGSEFVAGWVSVGGAAGALRRSQFKSMANHRLSSGVLSKERSSTFRSSRTLPGKSCVARAGKSSGFNSGVARSYLPGSWARSSFAKPPMAERRGCAGIGEPVEVLGGEVFASSGFAGQQDSGGRVLRCLTQVIHHLAHGG